MTDYLNKDAPAATEAFKTAAWKVMLYQEADVISCVNLPDHPQLKSFKCAHKGQEKLLKWLYGLWYHTFLKPPFMVLGSKEPLDVFL